jgi:signal peptidase I
MLKKIYNWSSSWTGTIVIVLTIIFFVAQAFVIPSGSMKNTLLIGDMLFVKKFAYGVPTPTIPWIEVKVLPDFKGNGHLIEGERPKRGDIVVFRYPHDPDIHYVKRAVATSGDTIFLKNKILYLHPKEGNDFVKTEFKDYETIDIDGKLFVVSPYEKEHKGIHNDPNVTRNLIAPKELFDMQEIVIPEDETFMMGDNRDHSNDSRFWGSVPYKYIVGKPWFIYFSWDDDYKIRWDRVFRTVESLEKDIEAKINHITESISTDIKLLNELDKFNDKVLSDKGLLVATLLQQVAESINNDDQLEIITTEKLGNGTIKPSLNLRLFVPNLNQFIDYDKLSGGNKLMADIRFLKSITELLGGIGMLFMDEVFKFFDDTNIISASDLIKEFKVGTSFLILHGGHESAISHDIIEVTLDENDGSKYIRIS